ncbi:MULTISPECIES: hypothetical protein [unclassified Modestobacter]
MTTTPLVLGAREPMSTTRPCGARNGPRHRTADATTLRRWQEVAPILAEGRVDCLCSPVVDHPSDGHGSPLGHRRHTAASDQVPGRHRTVRCWSDPS